MVTKYSGLLLEKEVGSIKITELNQKEKPTKETKFCVRWEVPFDTEMYKTFNKCSVGQYMTSPKFEVDGDSWNFRLYPMGEVIGDVGKLHFFIEKCNSRKRDLAFSVFALKEDSTIMAKFSVLGDEEKVLSVDNVAYGACLKGHLMSILRASRQYRFEWEDLANGFISTNPLTTLKIKCVMCVRPSSIQ